MTKKQKPSASLRGSPTKVDRRKPSRRRLSRRSQAQMPIALLKLWRARWLRVRREKEIDTWPFRLRPKAYYQGKMDALSEMFNDVADTIEQASVSANQAKR